MTQNIKLLYLDKNKINILEYITEIDITKDYDISRLYYVEDHINQDSLYNLLKNTISMEDIVLNFDIIDYELNHFTSSATCNISKIDDQSEILIKQRMIDLLNDRFFIECNILFKTIVDFETSISEFEIKRNDFLIKKAFLIKTIQESQNILETISNSKVNLFSLK
jgi:hypothetical protein